MELFADEYSKFRPQRQFRQKSEIMKHMQTLQNCPAKVKNHILWHIETEIHGWSETLSYRAAKDYLENWLNSSWKSLFRSLWRLNMDFGLFFSSFLGITFWSQFDGWKRRAGFPCFVLLKTNFLIGFCEERNSYILVWWVATTNSRVATRPQQSCLHTRWNCATLWQQSKLETRRGWYYWCAPAMEMSHQSCLGKKPGGCTLHTAHSAQSRNSRNINIFHKLRHRGEVHQKKGALEMQYVDNVFKLWPL